MSVFLAKMAFNNSHLGIGHFVTIKIFSGEVGGSKSMGGRGAPHLQFLVQSVPPPHASKRRGGALGYAENCIQFMWAYTI